MRVTVVGCGDAFGSGGRLNTCFLVEDGERRFLLDCGATGTVGLNRIGADFNGIETIVLSHLHGDHFAGVIFFLLHAQHVARRTAPLTVVGPPGTEARLHTASEALFPGSMQGTRRHPLTFVEVAAGATTAVGDLAITPFLASHPSGAPSHALRISLGGRVLAFSGDTEWVDDLVPCADAAHLFIVECYEHQRDVPYHLNWRTLSQKLESLTAQRILISHMNAVMLAARHNISDRRIVFADDGLILDV